MIWTLESLLDSFSQDSLVFGSVIYSSFLDSLKILFNHEHVICLATSRGYTLHAISRYALRQ